VPAVLSWVTGGMRAASALLLVVLTALAVTALAPQAAGFDAHVVVSGSMAPHVHPGDVVLTVPASVADLRPGQVVLFADPQRPDRLLLHRLVSLDTQGRLVTRGDANQSEDSVHVAPSAVRGLARLRIPFIGLPALWRAEGRSGQIALVAAVLAGAAVSVFGRHGQPRPGRAAVGTAQEALPVGR
jgi:signal peptidase I